MNIESQKQILKLENMFNKNIFVKHSMLNTEPKEEYFYSPEMVAKYSDMFLGQLDVMKRTLISMFNDFPVDGYSKEDVEQLFLNIEQDVLRNYINSDQIKEMFKKHISSLRPNFAESVNENYRGYLLARGQTLIKPTTINELLHLHHSATLNDEKIFESMPLIKSSTYKKETELDDMEDWMGIKYYGIETEMANDVFNASYNVMYNSSKYGSSGSVSHVISLPNKVLAMYRDLGHATMMEIDYDDKNVEVKYFIPKICNEEMVKKLPGVFYISGNKVSDVARGSFLVNKENFTQEFEKLLNDIPMDHDMDFGFKSMN